MAEVNTYTTHIKHEKKTQALSEIQTSDPDNLATAQPQGSALAKSI
jgi:hypothetical protein